jgi:hypothetical protein
LRDKGSAFWAEVKLTVWHDKGMLRMMLPDSCYCEVQEVVCLCLSQGSQRRRVLESIQRKETTVG